MPELDFAVGEPRAARHAALPMLEFPLRIGQGASPAPIRSIALQCQLRIDARRRVYADGEHERLADLFGEASRWSETLHSLLWQHVHMNVPAFDAVCETWLPVPCSFDFNVAATKYFHGLDAGDVPLSFLFSGSVFYRDAGGNLAMDLVDWKHECSASLPVATWREMMEHYYPNRHWLALNRRAFDALYDYKQRHGYAGFDEALTSLLPGSTRAAS